MKYSLKELKLFVKKNSPLNREEIDIEGLTTINGVQ